MKERIRKWLEPLGLVLLLVAFGWQCLAEHSKQVKYEGYIYEMSQKLDAIWLGVYDEALHSDRYHGEALVATNYDALNGLSVTGNRFRNPLDSSMRRVHFSL